MSWKNYILSVPQPSPDTTFEEALEPWVKANTKCLAEACKDPLHMKALALVFPKSPLEDIKDLWQEDDDENVAFLTINVEGFSEWQNRFYPGFEAQLQNLLSNWKFEEYEKSSRAKEEEYYVYGDRQVHGFGIWNKSWACELELKKYSLDEIKLIASGCKRFYYCKSPEMK